MRRRGQGKRCVVLPFTLQQHVLTSVVTRQFASRGAQAQAVDIAALGRTIDDLTGQLTHRQLAWREHGVPMQHTVFQRLGQAGEQLALFDDFVRLTHAALDQQGGADMAVAVATAVRAIESQALQRIENALVGQHLEGCTGRLQGDSHGMCIQNRFVGRPRPPMYS